MSKTLFHEEIPHAREMALGIVVDVKQNLGGVDVEQGGDLVYVTEDQLDAVIDALTAARKAMKQ